MENFQIKHPNPHFTALCSFVFVCVSISSVAANLPLPILLNCGQSSLAVDGDGRNWTGDDGSKFLPSSQNTVTSRANSQAPSVQEIPYMEARIFSSQFTYTFPVDSGWKFIRLHFYPADYSKFDASNAVFSVIAGPYTLLHNFSTFITAEALNFEYLTREFTINTMAGFFNLTFVPSSHVPNAYAFVNGIEIISMPSIFSKPGKFILNGQFIQEFSVMNDTALQTVARLNVGGTAVSPIKDSGLFRTWYDDSPYIYGAAWGVSYAKDPNIYMRYTKVPSVIAPLNVYSTARSMGPDPNINKNYKLTWTIPIDAGFIYLVRLHFCEIKTYIFRPNQRVFTIDIDNQVAEREADVITWGNGNGVPVYKDYFFIRSAKSAEELLVAIYPNIGSGSQYFDAILNGLEIFKLNDSSGNLAGPNPTPPPQQIVDLRRASPSSKSGNSSHFIHVIAKGIVGGLLVVAILCLAFAVIDLQRRKGFTQLPLEPHLKISSSFGQENDLRGKASGRHLID